MGCVARAYNAWNAIVLCCQYKSSKNVTITFYQSVPVVRRHSQISHAIINRYRWSGNLEHFYVNFGFHYIMYECCYNFDRVKATTFYIILCYFTQKFSETRISGMQLCASIFFCPRPLNQ